MGIGKIESVFVSNVLYGTLLKYLTVKQISKESNSSPGNVRNYIKTLLEINAIKEHPCNKIQREKRYRLDRDYYIKNYRIEQNETVINEEILNAQTH